MRPHLPALATVALAASLTALVPSPAGAAGETCRGVPATLVGAPTVLLTGTEGRDVIVTNDSYEVRALGGDDLVCITGTGFPFVLAGEGDDVVDATAGTASPGTRLGDGDDTYYGSPVVETVVAGSDETTDRGHDAIDTGVNAGNAGDTVFSGERGLANADRVTGGLLTLSWLGRSTTSGSATAGPGSSFEVFFPNGTRDLAVDVAAGTLATGADGAMTLEGFAHFSVRDDRFLTGFAFRGSDRDESVELWNQRSSTRSRIAMAGGDDLVTTGRPAPGSSLSGGDGRDRTVTRTQSAVGLDLSREVVTYGSGGRRVRAAARGFEDAVVVSPTVRLTGTRGRNTLEVDACRATVRGRGGPDTLTALDNARSGLRIRCRNGRRMAFFGDGGRDTLTGLNGRDLLVGGPGRDRADGRQSRDTCEAEVEKSCEVRR